MSKDPTPAPGVWGFRSSPAVIALAAASILGGGAARAHDLWLVPGSFRPGPGDTLRVFINNGDRFPESLTLLGEHRVASLSIRDPVDAVEPSPFRVDGASLTFEFSVRRTGTYVLGLETRPRTVRLKSSDFDDYLEEEELSAMIALREARGSSGSAAVERYTKWAKAMIVVPGEAREGAEHAPLGHRLEIVPDVGPGGLAPGAELPLRVLYDDAPLGSARVVFGRAGRPGYEPVVTTDDDGRARVRLAQAGRWFARVLHMIPVEDDPQVEWESFWATLTFEIQEQGNR